jgi:diguanylate cyclase (GGDEF)-like protein
MNKPFPEIINVLLVEDTLADSILIANALSKEAANGYKIKMVESLSAALTTLQKEEFDVILLDYSLPDSVQFSGLLTVQNQSPKTPVILLTSQDDEEIALNAVKNGAQDYFFKNNVRGKDIVRAIKYSIQRKQFEETLIIQANYDQLTGLANRILFNSRLDMAIARSKRNLDGICVFFIDLNDFKKVNDTLGHAAGDRVLKEAALRMKKSIRPYDTAARFGGDEFAILVEGIKQEKDCNIIAKNIIHKVTQSYDIGQGVVSIGASIGIASCMYGENFIPTEILRRADEAMYKAKGNIQSSFEYYEHKKAEAPKIKI